MIEHIFNIASSLIVVAGIVAVLQRATGFAIAVGTIAGAFTNALKVATTGR